MLLGEFQSGTVKKLICIRSFYLKPVYPLYDLDNIY